VIPIFDVAIRKEMTPKSTENPVVLAAIIMTDAIFDMVPCRLCEPTLHRNMSHC
jgi:hypothetical protein